MNDNRFGAGKTENPGVPGGGIPHPHQPGLPPDATDYVLELDEDFEEAPSDSLYQPGQNFAEYRLVRLALQEPVAELWEAYDVNLDCARALKILRPELVQDAQAVEQFFQQAWAQARLQHPNVLQVQRVGRFGPGEIPFFVSEWVDGETLEQRLEREGALAPVAAWDILRQIISGLGYALEQGMIHRDLHPGNILLENPIRDSGDRRVRVRIKDFGMAAIFDAPMHGKTAVLPGSRPEYAAPEIVTGMEVGHRADVYSLGILLYHMLTGFAPFQGAKRGEILFKQVHDPLPALSPPVREAIGAEGMAVLTRMTQKRPDLRYASYDELLEATLTSPIMSERRKAGMAPVADPGGPGRGIPGPVNPTPRGVPSVVPSPAPAKRKLLPLAAAAVVVLVAGGVVLKLKQPGSVVNPEPLLANTPAVPAAGTQTAPAPVAEAVRPAGGSVSEAAPSVAASIDSVPEAPGEMELAAAGAGAGETTVPPSLSSTLASGVATPKATPAVDPSTPVWSSLVETTPVPAPGEIIVDNATPGALRLSPTSPGTWRQVSLPGAYAYSSLLATADGTEKTATFLADIEKSGEYEVFLSWVSGGPSTRSSSVVVTVHTAKGPFKGVIDQTGEVNAGGFFPIGTYELPAGKEQEIVTISTDGVEPGPDRMVSVDAMKLVFAGGGAGAGASSASGQAAGSASHKLPAGAIVVESGFGGKNHEQYKEVSGRWLDSKAPVSAAKSTAYGLSPVGEVPGRKFVFSTVGSDTAAKEVAEARFFPELELAGRFHVYVTWPHGGNITPLHYVVRHANGATTRTLTQDGYGPGPGTPNNANVWIRLGEFDFAPGQENYVAMVVQPGARAVHTTANGQAYADAVCFSPALLPDAQDDDQTTTRSIMMPLGGGQAGAQVAQPVSAR